MASSVTQPASPRNVSQEFAPTAELQSVYFPTDKSVARGATRILDRDAEWLKAHPTYAIRIAGYSDERGSTRYNRVLAERRAEFVRNQLVARGVQADRISVVSYGELWPGCRPMTASCLARNRRADVLVARADDDQRP